MEILLSCLLFPDFTSPPLYYLLAAVIATTAFCVVCYATWKRLMDLTTSGDATSVGRSTIEPAEIIRTRVLSYMDCASLCKLSMTNSLMRKTSNDDNVWKALYHKDFWLEQDAVTPNNGWKAYYASTRAIMNVIAQLYNYNNKEPMSELWLNDYITCIQSPGNFESGYVEVSRDVWMENLEIREIRVRVMNDIGWVTLKLFVPNPYYISSVFEYHNGRWYIVIHHSSAVY